MKIEQAATDSIIPYRRNNRAHPKLQIKRIADSIKEFGFNQPIVVDEDSTVLVGHGRLLAAQQLGHESVPVVRVSGLTKAQKRGYRILDNKLQNDSAWDFGNLREELDGLIELGFPMESWGLDELQRLFPETEPEIVEDDGGPTVAEVGTVIKAGDLIELNGHRVYCADCTQVEVAEPLDMVLTDPPYGVSYVGKTKAALTIENDELDEESLRKLWSGCIEQWLPALKEGGCVYAAVPAGPLREVFSSELKRRGILRQELVWVKDCMVLGHSDYHYKHEPILYGWKPGKAHTVSPDRSKTSVLEFARPKRSEEHPTMKPLALWGELINNSSKQGEAVFDPFLGSGTTLIACDQLSRKCVGVEIDPRYCDVIIQRYHRHCVSAGKPFKCLVNGEKYEPVSRV